jgi:drug/metabolite transporter (DMT)-like permease
MLGSAVLFGLMAIVAGVASRRIPGPQVALVRFAVGIAAVAVAAALGRPLRPRRWGWLFLRGFFGGVAVFSYFSCIAHVGAGLATLLNYTSPVWSLLLGWWLLDEQPRRSAAAALTLTLIGVVFVVSSSLRSSRGGLWVFAGVFSAFASGVAVTSIRAVRRPGQGQPAESAWSVFASFTTLGFLAALPGVLGPLGRWVSPTRQEWALLFGVGLLSVGAQLTMTQALEHLTGATMGIIQQLAVVVALAGGVLMLGERLTGWSLFGSVLTLAGVAWIVVAASRPPTPAPDVEP